MPTKGDWASCCLKDLKDLDILCSLEDIQSMTYNQFKKQVKERVKENAYKYLMNKVGSKGKENVYTELTMADYLLPENKDLSISQKQQLFAVKNRMVTIPANFPKPKTEYICQCGSKEDMEHIFYCSILNEGRKNDLKYEKLYKGANVISNGLNIYICLPTSETNFLR